jgi:hypothetical protein
MRCPAATQGIASAASRSFVVGVLLPRLDVERPGEEDRNDSQAPATPVARTVKRGDEGGIIRNIHCVGNRHEALDGS